MDYIERTKQVPQVRLWMALGIAAAVVVILGDAIGPSIGRDDSGALKRWTGRDELQETEAFAKAVNHPQDRGQWQSGARTDSQNGPADASNLLVDYAFPRVSVYSVPNVRPAHARATLQDLGDLAQVRAIDAIESASGRNPWDELRKTLSTEDEPGEKDPFLFERVLVATVAKGVKWPSGDRLVWTRTFVQPINFKFTAYTIATTENETVKVSSVEATNVRKLSADVGLAIPGMDGSKIGLTPSHENTVKTTSDVVTQFERLGIDIMPDFLRIIRESGAGGDIGGNTTVALSMTTDPDLIAANARHGKPKPPGIDLVVTGLNLEEADTTPSMTVLPLVPLPHCALTANVSAVYEQRHIQGGREFYDEARQKVLFIHDVDAWKPVDIVGADDVSPFIWRIQLVPPRADPNDNWAGHRHALNARFNGSGSWRELVFSDYGRAVKLAHWVHTHPMARLSGYEFNETRDMGLAVVKQANDECKFEVARPEPESDVPAELPLEQ